MTIVAGDSVQHGLHRLGRQDALGPIQQRLGVCAKNALAHGLAWLAELALDLAQQYRGLAPLAALFDVAVDEDR